MWFLNTGNHNTSSCVWHYSPTLRRCLQSASFPQIPNGWCSCLWHFSVWGKVQEPKTSIYFSPLLSRKAVEAPSVGEDLEGRERVGIQSKPSERGGVQKHWRARDAAVVGCKRGRGLASLRQECVCKWGDSDRKILSLNQLIITAVCQLTNGAQKQVPALQILSLQRNWGSFDFTDNTVKQ